MAKHMTDSNSTPTQEQIARRAYEIFTERGQPEGQDLEHWLEAEKQLHATGQSKGAPQTNAPQTVTAAPARATQPAPVSNGNGNGRSQGNGRAARPAAARK
jgi:hypothetical protein